VHFGPRLGIERCGKIQMVHSGAESWTGIGVVADFCVGRRIRHWPHVQHGDIRWRIRLLQIPQELRLIYKTRNQLHIKKLLYWYTLDLVKIWLA